MTKWVDRVNGRAPRHGREEKASDSQAEMLEPLRVHKDANVPGVWRYKVKAPVSLRKFYTADGVKQARDWLEGALEFLDAQIKKIREEIPKTKPGKS